MNIKYIYINIFFIIFSCSDKKDNNEKRFFFDKVTDELVVNLDKLSFCEMNYSDFFSDYLVIPLETSPNCLINEVNKIDVYNDEYYIFDRKSASILVFDCKGGFVRRIGKKGKGPGEFIQPTSISINKEKGVLGCIDGKLKKVILFTTAGELIKEIRLKGAYIYHNLMLLDKEIIFDVLLTERSHKSKKLIYSIDYEGNNLWDWIPKHESISELKVPMESSSKTLIASESGFTFRRTYMNSIYKYNNSKIEPSITFKSKYCVDDDDIPLIKDLIKTGMKEYSTFIRSRMLFNGIMDYYESEDYYFFSFTYKNEICYIIFNRKNDSLLCIKNMTDDMASSNCIDFTDMYQDKLICCSSWTVKYLIDNDNLKVESKNEISMSSNPPIIIYKLKETLPINED